MAGWLDGLHCFYFFRQLQNLVVTPNLGNIPFWGGGAGGGGAGGIFNEIGR